MVLNDAEQRYDPRVFIRGNPANPGERVPRQFIRIVAGDKQTPFPHGSGRLDLARAITAPDNPLTSRVLVNRVWMHHFGEPLVESPSDLGLRTGPGSHPELLDYLAGQFIADGWSLKRLHRTIMLSNTYQQASRDRPDCRKVDPDNRLLWRANRRRLDLEAMRDSMLFLAGKLDSRMFGRPVDVVQAAEKRRTVYGLVDRQSLPGMFRAFDFASPDQSADRRPRTTVPQQALFAMNSPFVIEQARGLMSRSDVAAHTEPRERIKALYRLLFTRPPSEDEIALGITFINESEPQGEKSQGEKSQLNRWQQYAQVLLLSNELMFVE
jgi:hypothetical protein